ncbi:MAG: HAMP domain-containing histidine kinase [Sulfurospirillum sp.]|nr:HAMP domain-containing histidine kinase [Sulfurospirillum sp.]
MKTSKELVIDLSAYEKKSLIRVLLVYLFSVYFFAVVVSFLFYQIQIKNLFETHQYKIEKVTSKISNQLIASHMLGDKSLLVCFEKEINACFADIAESKNYEIALYDINNTPINKGFDIDLEKSEHFFMQDEALYFIDDSVQMHLNIRYIVAKDVHINEKIRSIQIQVATGLALGIIFATIVGIFLARLFLAPIRSGVERLNNFIKDSTHELNTPISAILMSVGSLKNIDEKKRKRIELSAKRIASLYQNLCYMLMRDTQKLEPKKMVNIKHLVQERLQYVEDFMEIKKIKLFTNLVDKELFVAKESMIKLIDNLLSNAVKYSKINGSITIILSDAFLQVQDTGVGVKKEMHKKIFKRYQRSNATQGGFGIGLDIVLTVCKEHNFTLDLVSNENEGSIFSVYF